MASDGPRPSPRRREVLNESLASTLQSDLDLVETNILRRRDLDDACNGVERGVGLLRRVVVEDDLNARVGILSNLHDEPLDGAASRLDRARGRHRGAKCLLEVPGVEEGEEERSKEEEGRLYAPGEGRAQTQSKIIE
jgi:hypothetical protein